MRPEPAIVFTGDYLSTPRGKTCHGLIRGTSRFDILGVIDSQHAGKDAGEVIDGKPRNIQVYASVRDFLVKHPTPPRYCIVGVAFHGGRLPESCRSELYEAMRNNISLVNGLHQLLGEDPEFQRIALDNRVEILDVRKPRPTQELHFWSGEIYSVKTPRIAVLGTDTNIGKRTTCRMILEACQRENVRAEMIYTGQTGWMQGNRFGFIFDATPNDFISGEIEWAILECEREAAPEVILIEGQSSLRNPSGPCGAEFICSGDARNVVLQHAPGRRYFNGHEEFEIEIPLVASEIELLNRYGARTLAVTLNEQNMDETRIAAYQKELARQLNIPVIRPLKEGVGALLPVIRELRGKT